MSTRAYCKMMMHSARYPSYSINGLLLSKASSMSSGSKLIQYLDCIPLFHINTGLVISGFYHAHDNLRDTHVDLFSQKIADKIAENRPGTLLVTIDSKRLSLNIDCPGLILHQHDTSGKWKTKDKNSLRLEHDSITLACASALIHKKIYRDLVDFDIHLDDISLDYLNVELNMEIDSCL